MATKGLFLPAPFCEINFKIYHDLTKPHYGREGTTAQAYSFQKEHMPSSRTYLGWDVDEGESKYRVASGSNS